MIGLAPEDLADLRRWAICGAVVLFAHGGIAGGDGDVARAARRDTGPPPASCSSLRRCRLRLPGRNRSSPRPRGGCPTPLAQHAGRDPEEKQKTEQKREAKLEQKVEEKVETKPIEEPPPEVPPAPNPEVAIEPPPPQEVKQEPRSRRRHPAFEVAPAPQVVAEEDGCDTGRAEGGPAQPLRFGTGPEAGDAGSRGDPAQQALSDGGSGRGQQGTGRVFFESRPERACDR